MKIYLLIMPLLFSPVLTHGDQLRLRNGDLINGTQSSLDGEVLIWNSSIFGEISIPRDQIVGIQSDSDSSLLANNVRETRTNSNRMQNFFANAARFIDSVTNTTGNVDLSIRTRSGNTEQENYSARSELVWGRSARQHKLDLDYNFESSNSKTVAKETHSLYQFNIALGTRWFANSQVDYTQDDFRRIDQRIRYGLGIGYHLRNNGNTSLSSTIGAHYSDEELVNSDDRQSIGWRMSTELKHDFDDSNLSFFLKHYMHGSFKYTSDLDSDFSVGTRYHLSPQLTTSISWDWTFDKEPASTISRHDRKWKIGVGFVW